MCDRIRIILNWAYHVRIKVMYFFSSSLLWCSTHTFSLEVNFNLVWSNDTFLYILSINQWKYEICKTKTVFPIAPPDYESLSIVESRYDRIGCFLSCEVVLFLELRTNRTEHFFYVIRDFSWWNIPLDCKNRCAVCFISKWIRWLVNLLGICLLFLDCSLFTKRKLCWSRAS